jgi:hypothetical protein
MRLTGYETLHCDAGWRVFSFLKLTTEAGLTGVIERLAARLLGSNPCGHCQINESVYTAAVPCGILAAVTPLPLTNLDRGRRTA